MTHRRYIDYQLTLARIAEAEECGVDPTAAALLRELAQDMLLSRARSAGEVEELSQQGAIILTHLTAVGGLERSEAEDIWGRLRACGPRSRDRAAADQVAALT